MKFYLFLLFSCIAFPQNLYDTWVDKDFNKFVFTSDSLCWPGNNYKKYEWRAKDSTIKIVTYSASQKKNGEWDIRHPINLIRVTSIGENEILLRPVNKEAKSNFFHSQERKVFTRLSSIALKRVDLSEMYFRSSACLGNCQPVEFFLDSCLNFFFIGGYNLENRRGFFKGKLTLADKESLEKILSKGYIQKIPAELGRSIYGQYIKIILKRDGIIQKIEGTAIPDFSGDMISDLINFHKRLILIKQDEFNLGEEVISIE